MKYIITLILVFGALWLNAQEVKDSSAHNSKRYIQKIYVLTPGVSGEYLLNPSSDLTINYNLGLKLKNLYLKIAQQYDNDVLLFASLSIELRKFLNKDLRVKNNKRVDKFSGAYCGLKVEYAHTIQKYNYNKSSYYTFYEDDKQYVDYIEIGPVIGFQRAIGKIFYWDVNAGVGAIIYDDVFGLNFNASIKIGFAF